MGSQPVKLELVGQQSPLEKLQRSPWDILTREMIISTLIVLVLMISARAFMPYPWHASCEVKWTIPSSCEQFKTKIINQMDAWKGEELCPPVSEDCPTLPCGQRCLYNFTSYDDLTIIGTHQTPKHRFTDDLTFLLSDMDSSRCSVEATSNSRLSYAVLDFGTNYCNLRNLVEGAGISSLESFEEETEDSICTQYSSRNCDRF